MAQKVELRKRNGSFSGNDNLMLPVTHVNFVLGLLDENSNKLKTSLLPSSMLNTKRMAGSINSDTNFGNIYTLIEDFNESDTPMYPGTYFISNGKHLISASTDHVIYYNDDGLNATNSVELEHGDHLFYVKKGSEYSWTDTGDTVNVPEGDGIADLSAPYNSILPSHIFATESDAVAFNPLANGVDGLVTGFRWVSTNSAEYNAAGHKIDKTTNLEGNPSEAEANRLVIPTYTLWDHGQWSVALKITDGSVGTSYWKLLQVDPKFGGSPKVYESTTYSNKHIWGVVNNTYDLVTTSSAGLMSAVDKVKLNSLSNYVHPDYTKQEVALSGVEVITGFKSDILGHVTSISTGALPYASTDAAGVVELATESQGERAQDSSRALTPSVGLSMIKHHQDVSYFGSLTAANGAGLPDGAIAIISQPGTINI